MSDANVQPKSLQEVRSKRNDFLRALAHSSDRSPLLLPNGGDFEERNDMVAFAVQILTWVLGEESVPQKKWNTDTRLPVGTWRQYEEPTDPIGLRELKV